MPLAHRFTRIAQLIGHPSRALMLDALLGAEALSAGALADSAGITAQTASRHLQLLLDADLLSVQRQGRCRYFRIADAKVHQLLQQLAEIRLDGKTPPTPDRASSALRTFRRCYRHMAGKFGVALTQALLKQGRVLPDERGFTLADSGARWLQEMGLDVAGVLRGEGCVDWTENVPHIGGSLGVVLLEMFLDKDYVRASATEPRVLHLTEKGRAFWIKEWGALPDE
ncbi:MAG: helix-turn-helix transcriptional regulator [Neisseria sp.]|nr:helix-turn-helix transcriptional regulator [Neisseria sp.]